MRRGLVTLLVALGACGHHGGPTLRESLTIVELVPAPFARGVEPEAVVRITFSEELDPLTLGGDACTLADARGRMPARVDLLADGRTLEVVPLAGFGRGREVRGAVAASVRARTGRSVAGSFTWSFSVRDGRWERVEDLVSVDATLTPLIAQRADGTAFAALGTTLLALPDGDVRWARLDPIPVPGVLEPRAVHLAFDPDQNLLVGVQGNPTPRSLDGFVVRSRGLSGWQAPERVGTATSLFLPSLAFRSTALGDLTFSTSGCQGPSTCGTNVLWAAPAKGGALRWLSAGGIFFSAFPRAADDGDGQGRHFWLRHSSTGTLDVVRYESELGTQTRHELEAAIPREELYQLAIVATLPGPAFVWLCRGSGTSARLELLRFDAAKGFGPASVPWTASAPLPVGEHPRFALAESASGHVLVAIEEPLEAGTARLWALAYEPTLGTLLGPVAIAERTLRGSTMQPRVAVALSDRGEGIVAFLAMGERGPALATVRFVPASGFEARELVRVLPVSSASVPGAARIDDQGRALVLVSDPSTPTRHAVVTLR